MPPKNSLGKGLGALFPDLLNHIGDRPSFVQCGIEELTPNRFQSRRDFNDEDQKELVVSVKKSGIIQPIVVRKADNAATKSSPGRGAGGRHRRPGSKRCPSLSARRRTGNWRSFR